MFNPSGTMVAKFRQASLLNETGQAVNMVLKVVTTLHLEVADVFGFNLSSFSSRRDEKVVAVGAERESADFTENTMQRGQSTSSNTD